MLPGGFIVVKQQGCDVIVGTGMYRCPEHTAPPRFTVGLCLVGGAAAVFGGAASACVGFDAKGVGAWAAGETNVGPHFGAGVSGQVALSNGNIADQAGPFDTVSGGGGPYSGSVAWGQGADGQNVYTVMGGAGPGTYGGGARGESDTFWYWHS